MKVVAHAAPGKRAVAACKNAELTTSAKLGRRLRIALTPGEPAGIGPDLVIDLAMNRQLATHSAEVVVIADPQVMRDRAAALGADLEVRELGKLALCDQRGGPNIQVLPIHAPSRCKAGVLNTNNAEYVLETLRCAADGCLEGQFDALVTAPVHKGIINQAGFAFTGHTEFLAERTGSGLPVMMLATPGLRVALATTHLPLRAVADAITPELLARVLQTMDHDLRHLFDLDNPRIVVCGLNPHAGEDGHLGHEEIEVIDPTLQRMRAKGLNIIGPLPADTLFTPHVLDGADAVLAMYHDQGLPVLKHTGFGHSLNITLGLPIVRTSVDHGTALDLAGTGKADSGSLKFALNTAIEIAEKASATKR